MFVKLSLVSIPFFSWSFRPDWDIWFFNVDYSLFEVISWSCVLQIMIKEDLVNWLRSVLMSWSGDVLWLDCINVLVR